jgi:transcriptional regulator with XRE-family HTH domain
MVTGDDVKHARGRLHLTQTQLAGMLGVSRRTVAEWETSGDLSATIVGRLSGVFADAGPATTPDAPPLAAVSDLELVTEMGRRLASLRAQIDAAALARPDETTPQTDVTPQTGHPSDSDGLPSPDGPVDAGGSGIVGTEIVDSDSATDAPRFTDRPGAS